MTQGNHLAMPRYSLAVIPLIRRLNGICRQVWYADDSAAIGKITQVREWWETLTKVVLALDTSSTRQRQGL